MSAGTGAKYPFFVYAPDKKEMDANQKRLDARLEHLINFREKVGNGVFSMGGGLLDETSDPANPDPKRLVGSAMIIQATSRDEVINLLKSDPYYANGNGAWDEKNWVVLPMVLASKLPETAEVTDAVKALKPESGPKA